MLTLVFLKAQVRECLKLRTHGQWGSLESPPLCLWKAPRAVYEPYTYRRKVTGLGDSVGVVKGEKPEENVGAAALHVPGDLTTTKITSLCTSHCICIQVCGAFREVFLVSLYCQFKDDIEKYLEQLRGVLQQLSGKRILIAADANAKSEWWGSPSNDNREKILEDFILSNDLIVVNKPGGLQTCRTARGESNIDVTLITPNLQGFLSSWKVESWTTSDHTPITIELHFQSQNAREPRVLDPRFNLRKADWEEFDRVLLVERDRLNKLR
ncbi:hypothetical protein TSAR_006291 [Trichomalopsis sarcophagae]|uniref:Endonuclease/exonuclease/phosphatase domain-containing protein n=1 Tax=Trichomalopsis sarcophagae TaxID=543379 RepID=A0A232EFR3_9HYME|nr:hypothetical protein TSAR_006291 [Trichomalopsis sarcophagae]